MDVMRGEWLMSFPGLQAYAPIAHKLITGEQVSFDAQAGALMSVVDANGKMLNPDEDGALEVPKGSVAIVRMIGAIIKYGDWCTYGADEIVGALRAAENNPNIIGTVLLIDGPGGAVSAIGPFKEFAKTKTKPVVALADQCCSLHYWAMCAVADRKMADNDVSALFGSIGVVCSFADNREYLEKLGYKFHEIYPEESKHKNEAFRLALKGDYHLIVKEQLSPIAIKFQAAVRQACPNLKEEVGVLTGKTFPADEALRLGMIDKIGSQDEAVQLVHVLSELGTFNN